MLKEFFPILTKNPHLVYLDSAATALKPREVLEAMEEYYEFYSANVHRGLYAIAERATEMYERSRAEVAKFIRAGSEKEVIFVKNATEGMNFLASSLCRFYKNGEVVTTIAEHHSTFIPWQKHCAELGLTLKVLNFNNESGWEELNNYVTPHTKALVIHHISNVLGNKQDIKALVQKVRALNPQTHIIADGAQGAPHEIVDVAGWDVDAYVCTGHKLYGPTGIGVVYAKEHILNELEPFMWGGEMVGEVTTTTATATDIPHKFEAGTPPIAQAIGLAAAVRFLSSLEREHMLKREKEHTDYLLSQLKNIPGVTILGENMEKYHLVSLHVQNVHAHDVAQYLDEHHICVRAGNHCTQPLHTYLGITNSLRVSLGMYTTQNDLDIFLTHFKDALKVFAP